MKPVDGVYLYGLGKEIQKLRSIRHDNTYSQIWATCYLVRRRLKEFLSDSDYSSAIRITVDSAERLINELEEVYQIGRDSKQKNEMLGEFELELVSDCVREFESVFRAEFRHGNLFLATPKGAYDLRMLITNGESLLPSDFLSLCPEDAHKDVQEGARCLAFELYTASGFHFHRANESVLVQYLKARDVDFPKNKNMGAYIKLLEKCSHPPKEIIACLTNLKDMHRNPLMHPEQSIDSFDEANALFGAIHTAVSAMLKEIKQIQDEDAS